MKVKIFRIRLSEDFQTNDEKILNDFIAFQDVIKMNSSLVKDDENYWSVMIYYDELKNKISEKKSKFYAESNSDLTADESKILESLRIWRNEKAKKNNLPAYFIATNNELISIAKYKPVHKEELMSIKGFGKFKFENYGEEIIEVLENV